MDYTLILHNISKHITLTEKETTYFTSLLESKKLKAKKAILQEGDICKHIWFVTKGCLRAFTVDKNGYEHVLQFAPSDWWMADLYSFISQQPGLLTIEALEETDLVQLSKVDQDSLYQEVPKFERFFRVIAEKALVASQVRVLNNMSITAEERYVLFCKQYPNLINSLPQKQIASYIGVTPEFLSKMRTQLLRNK